uniref:Uncharacterized protein n=1 Tax=Odontella aurita TaxID=265563 RepID=A0A7S4JB50_9STRA|mmetsp:Transcript_42936/g.130637  ORF Transcript_42936/g.130637 Transcript_42936/m.130637 type:complete len:417 (+) Transcript_42936:163-1413(+)
MIRHFSAHKEHKDGPSVLQGNTSPGRLRLLDEALLKGLLCFDRPSCSESEAGEGSLQQVTIVDLGLGDSPTTTIEFASALKGAYSVSSIPEPSELKVVGVEVEPDRLDQCKCLLEDASRAGLLRNIPTIDLRLGGMKFSLPLFDSEPRPRLIRAMNVLRSYNIPDAVEGLKVLFHQLSSRGGTLIEGSAEARGLVVVAMSVIKPTPDASSHVDNDDDSIFDEMELGIDAVVFAVDFDALASDPELSRMKSVPSWFNRHNHLPRLWRGFCDASECSEEDVPRWAAPVRSFLFHWAEVCDQIEEEINSSNPNASAEEILIQRVDEVSKCPRPDARLGVEPISPASLRERFMRSTEKLARQVREGTDFSGTDSSWLNTSQTSRGILIWYPGKDLDSGRPVLVVPDADEYYWWEERVGKK